MATSRRPAAVNMRDVARRAGVSAATVSRSLRGSTNVLAETRARVLRAAHEMGYVGPVSGFRTRCVGVLARYPGQWFHAQVISAIERVLRGAGYDLVLYNIGEADGRRNFFGRAAPRRELDGLIVVSSSFEGAEQESLKELEIPISVVGGYLPGYPRVGVDDVASVAMGTQHLIGLGHRRLGLIAFEPHSSVGQETTNARRAGFVDTLRAAGLEPRPEWVVADESDVTGGIRAAERLLTQPELPTALLAMSDEMALGALQTLRRAGIRVPKQMSLIGFDDHEMSVCGDLTTIAQPVRLQAEMATTILLGELAGTTGPIQHVDLPTRLVVRGSTGPPPDQP